jgi:hypothetical protein
MGENLNLSERADNMNDPVIFDTKKGCNDVGFELWRLHLTYLSFGEICDIGMLHDLS